MVDNLILSKDENHSIGTFRDYTIIGIPVFSIVEVLMKAKNSSLIRQANEEEPCVKYARALTNDFQKFSVRAPTRQDEYRRRKRKKKKSLWFVKFRLPSAASMQYTVYSS